MAHALSLRAGPRALQKIRTEGLQPEMISHIPAAAGGPKWLVLGRMDRVLFGQWLAGRTTPVLGIGASAGAWRLAAAAQQDVDAAFDRFEEAYVDQSYEARPSAAEVSFQGRRILSALLGEHGIDELLASPRVRINAVAARCLGLTAHPRSQVEAVGLATAVLSNTLSRRALGRHFERVLFHAPDAPLQLQADGFRTHHVPLTPANAFEALTASASIPRVMERVASIEGAPVGPYTDGGLIDYQMDLPLPPGDGLVLLPHFSRRVVPGWLDKFVPWRRARYLDNTVLLHPSDAFLQRLPGGRIPDRNDFLRHEGDDATRLKNWRQAIAESQALADEFSELVASEGFASRVQPL